jgi:hypothetical protein
MCVMKMFEQSCWRWLQCLGCFLNNGCRTLYISGFILNRSKGVIWALEDAGSYALNRKVRALHNQQLAQLVNSVYAGIVSCTGSVTLSLTRKADASLHVSCISLWQLHHALI